MLGMRHLNLHIAISRDFQLSTVVIEFEASAVQCNASLSNALDISTRQRWGVWRHNWILWLETQQLLLHFLLTKWNVSWKKFPVDSAHIKLTDNTIFFFSSLLWIFSFPPLWWFADDRWGILVDFFFLFSLHRCEVHVRTTWKHGKGNEKSKKKSLKLEFLIRCLAGGRHMSCIFLQALLFFSKLWKFFLYFILLRIISMNFFCFRRAAIERSTALFVLNLWPQEFRNHDGVEKRIDFGNLKFYIKSRCVRFWIVHRFYPLFFHSNRSTFWVVFFFSLTQNEFLRYFQDFIQK